MQLGASTGVDEADDAKLWPGLQHGHCCSSNMGHVSKGLVCVVTSLG